MSKRSHSSFAKFRIGAAVALCGLAAFIAPAATSFAQRDALNAHAVDFDVPSSRDVPATAAVRAEAIEFLDGMRERDAEAVWAFASEEDQDAFGTESAVYEAFAETFPALTQTREALVRNVRVEGDTPFVSLTLTSQTGEAYGAEIGFWLDDAGDWKVVSCDVTPASDQIAAL